MNRLSFNTETPKFSDRDSLSVFKTTSHSGSQIQPGMSLEEISNIVAENVMSIVRKQFEKAKADYHRATTE